MSCYPDPPKGKPYDWNGLKLFNTNWDRFRSAKTDILSLNQQKATLYSVKFRLESVNVGWTLKTGESDQKSLNSNFLSLNITLQYRPKGYHILPFSVGND